MFGGEGSHRQRCERRRVCVTRRSVQGLLFLARERQTRGAVKSLHTSRGNVPGANPRDARGSRPQNVLVCRIEKSLQKLEELFSNLSLGSAKDRIGARLSPTSAFARTYVRGSTSPGRRIAQALLGRQGTCGVR